MEDSQNGTVEETQRKDLRREEEEEGVEPEAEVSIDEKDPSLSFDDHGSIREEETDENGPLESLEGDKEVSELVFKAVEPVQSLPEAIMPEDSVVSDENNGSSSMVTIDEEEESRCSVPFPQTSSVSAMIDAYPEGFEESTLSNPDENRMIAAEERDLDLEETDKINGQDIDEKTGESSATYEDKTQENGNVAQVEAINGDYTATETPKTMANLPEPAISVTKRTSFLGCCGFLEVLRRSDR